MRTEETVNDNRKTVYYYDDEERHFHATDYDESGKMFCDIHYRFNNENLCGGWRVFHSNGNIICWFEVDYDELKREKEIRQFNKQNVLEIRTVSNYDENGFLISEIQFDGDGKEIEPDNF